MTIQELKLVEELFKILPTITIAVCLAIVYVKYQTSARLREEREAVRDAKITNNENNIVDLVKIHLERHPDDTSKFVKKEFKNTGK